MNRYIYIYTYHIIYVQISYYIYCIYIYVCVCTNLACIEIYNKFFLYVPPPGLSSFGIGSKKLMACCHWSAFLQTLIKALRVTTSGVTCAAAIELKSCRACCHSLTVPNGLFLFLKTWDSTGTKHYPSHSKPINML